MSNANPARAATQRMITRDALLGLLDALPPEELGDLLDELGVDGQVATPALPDPSMPVSYTHLDVYKRQVIRRRLDTGRTKQARDDGRSCGSDGAVQILRLPWADAERMPLH